MQANGLAEFAYVQKIQTTTYTYKRKHFGEIMEKITNGGQICFTRKGQEPFIITKVGLPTEGQLEEAKHNKRAQTISKLKNCNGLICTLFTSFGLFIRSNRLSRLF